MESFLIKALQLIVALAFLVVIHEGGHYFFARLFDIKVEKFYMFFNPWFEIAKWKPKPRKTPKVGRDGKEKATWRDTEYGIGWIPLGGYVKIAGMIDESMDKDQMAAPEQPWEFRAKPAWQRLLVMLGGVLFNFILAILIYAGIALYWGDRYIPLDAMREGFDYVPSAVDAGFRNGDRPYAVDGKPIDPTSMDYPLRMLEARNVTVIRNYTDTVDVAIPSDLIFRINDEKGFIAPRVPVVVKDVTGGSPAKEAGLQRGDRIVRVGDTPTPSYTELSPALKGVADTPTTVGILRAGSPDTLSIAITPNEYGKLGFQLTPLTEIYPTVTRRYGLFESIPKGVTDGTDKLANYAGSMKYVFTKEGAESIGGFGALGGLFPEKWDWYTFWQITAFLSVILAFMNFLPIPALDGGHIMFLLWEIVTGRKVNEKVLEMAQYVGMAFLILLLVYANGNDLIKAIR